MIYIDNLFNFNCNINYLWWSTAASVLSTWLVGSNWSISYQHRCVNNPVKRNTVTTIWKILHPNLRVRYWIFKAKFSRKHTKITTKIVRIKNKGTLIVIILLLNLVKNDNSYCVSLLYSRTVIYILHTF